MTVLRMVGGFALRLPVAGVVLYLGLVLAYAVGAGYGYRAGMTFPTPLNFAATAAIATAAFAAAASVVLGRWAGPRRAASAYGVLTIAGGLLVVWATAAITLSRFVG